MRWSGQEIGTEQADALPGLARLSSLVRSVRTPEFAGITFHEILAKSALNKVPGRSSMPFGWTINPYRGCSHSCVYCFARPTHEYLELDSGADFDNQIVVKLNVAEVLATELRRKSWGRHPVALGTNTDPYQRAEGRYRLMPGIIAALANSGTPFSILTKGTLLRRDLPLLAEAASQVPVDLAMSIAIFDDALQDSVEPGTPTATARLATITAAREAGFSPAVFMMPILPFLTDTRAHLDAALAQIKNSGAASVLYTALHLRGSVKEWYFSWLRREHPELLPRYAEMYRKGAYAPKEYRQWLAARIAPLIRKHGLRRGEEDPGTGGILQSTADAQPRAGARALPSTSEPVTVAASGTEGAAAGLRSTALGRRLIAEELPPGTAIRLIAEPQPTLF